MNGLQALYVKIHLNYFKNNFYVNEQKILMTYYFDTLKFVGSLFSKTMPYFLSPTQWQFKKYSNFIDAIHYW